MSQADQNTANIKVIIEWMNSVVSTAKKTSELTQQGMVDPTSKIRTEEGYITIQQLTNITSGLWPVIENCWAEKGAGKTSLSLIEATDIVYFKKITNGTDPMTLVGYTYDGGNKELLASYTLNQTMA